ANAVDVVHLLRRGLGHMRSKLSRLGAGGIHRRATLRLDSPETPGGSMRLRILALAAVALLFTDAARAAVFAVKPGKDTKVVFTSQAPTETFQGKTDRMEGTLTLDPPTVGDSITVHLEVDLASLDTGKKMRNQHMREN